MIGSRDAQHVRDHAYGQRLGQLDGEVGVVPLGESLDQLDGNCANVVLPGGNRARQKRIAHDAPQFRAARRIQILELPLGRHELAHRLELLLEEMSRSWR